MVGSTFHNLRFIEPNVCCTKCALLGRAMAVVSLNFVHAIHVKFFPEIESKFCFSKYS